MNIFMMIAAGAGIGLVSGLIGIGGGAMMVPLFVYWFKMDMVRAVGTSLAVIAPITLIGGWSHFMKGHVELAPVVWVAAGATAGMFASGWAIEWIPQDLLRKGFAAFLLFMAFKLFFKS